MPPIQNQLRNLQGSVQNENAELLVQKVLITSKWQQQKVKPSTGPYLAQRPLQLHRLHTHEAGPASVAGRHHQERPRRLLEENTQTPHPEKSL